MNVFRKIILGLLMGVSTMTLQAQVLDFDDLWAHYNLSWGNYGGFEWENFHVSSSDRGAYPLGATSGEHAIVNTGAKDGSLKLADGGLFDFNSAQMTAAWNKDLNVTVEGWLNGELVYRQTVVLSTSGPQLFVFDYMGIDKLTFNSFGGTPDPSFVGGGGMHFVMDDMTFNMAPSIPEPTTYALMIAGLGMIGVFVRRRKN